MITETSFIEFCKTNNIDEKLVTEFLELNVLDVGVCAPGTANSDGEVIRRVPINPDRGIVNVFIAIDTKITYDRKFSAFYGDDDLRNNVEEVADSLARTFPDPSFKLGKPTNNKVELVGILTIILNSIDDLEGGKQLNVYSDSYYSVNCLTRWYKTWQGNGWKNTKNKPVENQIIIKKCVEIIEQYPEQIHIHYLAMKPEYTDEDAEYYQWYGHYRAVKLLNQ